MVESGGSERGGNHGTNGASCKEFIKKAEPTEGPEQVVYCPLVLSAPDERLELSLSLGQVSPFSLESPEPEHRLPLLVQHQGKHRGAITWPTFQPERPFLFHPHRGPTSGLQN